MARNKTKENGDPKSPYDALPINPDEFVRVMRKRWKEADEELLQLGEQERRISRSLLSGRGRDGGKLSERGKRGLLSRLQGLHYRQSILILEGSSLAKQCAIQQHNRMVALAMAPRGKGAR